MARRLSADKHDALLRAATHILAKEGVSATTASIAQAAGVASGSLFNYFATKDVLLNDLYLRLKKEIADVLASDFPDAYSPKEKVRHIWTHYISWGLNFQEKRRVIAQLSLSHRVAAETIIRAQEPLAAVNRALTDSIPKGSPITPKMAAAMMSAFAEAVMILIEDSPGPASSKAAEVNVGFEAFWRAIGSD